jgi:hypothetical protein
MNLEAAAHKKRLGKDLTDEEIKLLEAKWQDKTLPPEPMYLDDIDLTEGLNYPTRNDDPTTVYCSFCGNPVDRINATYGQGTPRTIVKREVVEVAGTKILEEKVHHVTDKITSCPNCLGHMLTVKIKFPDFD